ncbi:DEAD/DEAH box helicase [Proteiniclasticum sp.]|uniref:DEAD/DEAH box helicase n=1 Tax=Proteiniclasticum sp. TaxID=2053595 RepID=UPI002898E685|nr:DEAD/DEAH box helicase [Proteiniclasticum sp.]
MSKEFKNINLDSEILKAVESLGFKELTEIQEKVGPLALAGENILGSSSTGSGKTLAFLMPIMERTRWEEAKASTLILAPSRELALQIKNEYDTLGRYKKLSCVAVFGKQPFQEQVKEMKNRHQAISGTPGRVLDHIKRGTIYTDAIQYLVIDEVDELLDRGFTDEVMDIVRHLKHVRQTMMFSATITENVRDLAMKITPDFKIVEAAKDDELNIEEVHYQLDVKDKWKALLSTIYGRKPKSMIIFVNTKDECDRIQQKLGDANIDALKIHGGMMQEDRLKAMERFKNKEIPYLVATDVASRGIDISDLDISLSYDFPVEKESYVHRKGRTGRNFKEGLAIYFITEYDARKVSEVEGYIGHSLGALKTIDYGPFKNEKDAFREFQKNLRRNRPSKVITHSDITKLYINAGKKKKIRPIDIVGTLNAIEGIEPEDIGIIKVMDMVSYIDIMNGKGELALKGLSERKIKGKSVRVEKAKK